MNKTKIEWADATWNPVIGCDKISAGCKNCYAEVMACRLRAIGVRGYENGFKLTLMPDRIDQPKRIKKATRFFVCSMSDLFHDKIPDRYIEKVFETIESTPRHTYQVLTKRSYHMAKYFRDHIPPPNVWFGVSLDQCQRKYMVSHLKQVPAKVRFLSIEPLLGGMGEIDLSGINWVIVGGESGNNARPMKKEWVLDILAQCTEQNIPFFFKQWGTWGEDGVKRNKKANGRLLNGQIYNEYPVLD